MIIKCDKMIRTSFLLLHSEANEYCDKIVLCVNFVGNSTQIIKRINLGIATRECYADVVNTLQSIERLFFNW